MIAIAAIVVDVLIVCVGWRTIAVHRQAERATHDFRFELTQPAVTAWGANHGPVPEPKRARPLLRRPSVQEPDDFQLDDGAAGSAPEPETPAPAEGVPAEGVPAEGVPAEGVPAEGVPAEGVPAEGAPDRRPIGFTILQRLGPLPGFDTVWAPGAADSPEPEPGTEAPAPSDTTPLPPVLDRDTPGHWVAHGLLG